MKKGWPLDWRVPWLFSFKENGSKDDFQYLACHAPSDKTNDSTIHEWVTLYPTPLSYSTHLQNASLPPSTLAQKHPCSLLWGWGKETWREAGAEIHPEFIFINENLFAVKQISHLWYLCISFNIPHLLIITVGCNVHSIKWAINTARVIAAHNS